MEGNASISSPLQHLAGVLKANIAVAERSLTLPAHEAHAFRRFTVPTAVSGLVTLCAAMAMVMLRRSWEPQLPRMSDAWMRNHDLEFGRYDHWREY